MNMHYEGKYKHGNCRDNGSFSPRCPVVSSKN